VRGFEENAVDRRRLAAAESLARATGVDYAVAYRHLVNNTANVLIQSSARAPRRRSSRSGLSPVTAVYVLQEKWEPFPQGTRRSTTAISAGWGPPESADTLTRSPRTRSHLSYAGRWALDR
jgi:hypothetical protein